MMTYSTLCALVLLGSGLLTFTACDKNDPESCTSSVVPVPADTYVFPIVPGTPAWATFQTGAEMVAACQLPAATLPRISTAGLVATCLTYPLLGNMLAANSLQRGTRAQLANFNGFGELQQRPKPQPCCWNATSKCGPLVYRRKNRPGIGGLTRLSSCTWR
ncbi:hypothetical protein H9L05_22680 (plasmid) [Hymenobacter qilianensis]|uniref:Uncharacterized protein n=1 Tax=Hymenobacter qilianensis TaxID=1385715 RepID=A0A7H0H1V3_9BACT|nr:hypothetical protein [Hymenobacter qilianensis]QNP54519.1 hypothetical protein H9L05_22680 [Hymenobacter qilianensis]